MAEVQSAPPQSPAPPPDNPVMTAEEAATWLSKEFDETPKEEETPAEQPAEAPQEEASEESDQTGTEEAPPDEAAPPSEEAEASEQEDEADDAQDDDLVPIDPPRTLSKDKRETFKSLPREVQERWAEIEDQNSREIQRIQSKSAEERRAMEAELKAAEEARQKYENALPQVMHMLNDELAAKFPDIKTWDDAQRLQAKDPNRYMQWDLLVKKQNAIQSDYAESQRRQREEIQGNFSRYVQEQDAKFIESHPTWGDADQGPKLQKAAVEYLEDVGYSRDEIADFWNNGQPLSARDYRFQSVIADLVDSKRRLKNAEQAVSRARAKPSQPVVRPGSPKPKGSEKSEEHERLQARLKQSGRVEDAVALLSIGAD